MNIIGLMSGTSIDGVDAAICEITGEPPQIQARILQGTTHTYPSTLRQQILSACTPDRSHVDLLCQLNVDLGQHFAAVVRQLIDDASFDMSDVDLIASHGQTVWHQVSDDGHVSATFQLTEAAEIAERTGITTISNFRARDVAVGGQGAPLTAYADWLLLRHPTHWRAIQNIGGIGNVTFLPPLSDSDSEPLAFDTGPGNVLIDAVVTKLTDGEKTFDRDGLMARDGSVDVDWLDNLLQHEYYSRQPPKTTGRELFSTEMGVTLVEEGLRRGLSASDVVATLAALTIRSIVSAYQRFAPAPIDEVILGGGGSRNPVLVQMLADSLQPTPVHSHEALGINSDFKESLVFALLAYETWHTRPGNHPALTGAQSPVVLGQITPGNNYAALIRQTWCK